MENKVETHTKNFWLSERRVALGLWIGLVCYLCDLDNECTW